MATKMLRQWSRRSSEIRIVGIQKASYRRSYTDGILKKHNGRFHVPIAVLHGRMFGERAVVASRVLIIFIKRLITAGSTGGGRAKRCQNSSTGQMR